MALIKTLDEIKALLPKLVSNLSDTTLLPNFDSAEVDYLVPVCGMALYNDISVKYNAVPQTLSAGEQVLLKHMQLLVVTNAFRDDMVANHVLWTDQGLRTITTQEMGKPVGWEYKELKQFFLEKSTKAEEVLLTYLWANKATYDLWTASDEYKEFAALLIKTGAEFKKYYRNLYQPMRTYYRLKSAVADVQEQYLESGVGTDLLAYLRDTDGLSDDIKKAVELLKKALVKLTLMRACNELPVRIGEAGLTVASDFGVDKDTEDGGRVAASERRIEKLLAESEKEGQNWLAKARHALYTIRKNSGDAAFDTAYDKGPLTGYVAPADRTSGNETRKIFRAG